MNNQGYILLSAMELIIMEEQNMERNQDASDKKREYHSPLLKRYEAPKLKKHQNYKDITLAPGASLPNGQPFPGPPGPDSPPPPDYSGRIFPRTTVE